MQRVAGSNMAALGWDGLGQLRGWLSDAASGEGPDVSELTPALAEFGYPGLADQGKGTGGSEAVIGADSGATLAGRAGSDLVLGGSGDDTLDGGRGDDTLYGGEGNDTYRFRGAFLAVGCLLAGLGLGQAQAGEDYATTFTPKADEAYQEDINVWVYTEDFAERFGMPQKWVSEKLNGAYAAAYRVEIASTRMMFPHKGENVSQPVRRCVLDLFLPDDANIPWANKNVAGMWWYTPDAPTYLIPQRPQDKEWQWRPVGLKGRAIIRYSKAGYGGLKVVKFKRRLYPGVNYISFNMNCTAPGKNLSHVEFLPKGASPKKQKKPNYKVRLPKTFMKDLFETWESRVRDPSEKEYKNILSK
jgi:hypothetical protein